MTCSLVIVLFLGKSALAAGFLTDKARFSPHAAKDTAARTIFFLRATAGEDHDEPDLFDYFDPLLSPHEYPNGISPQKKPTRMEEENSKSNSDDGQEPDLWEYFDPLLSPHKDPNGVSPQSSNRRQPEKQNSNNLNDPLFIYQRQSQFTESATHSNRPPVDTDKVFDPRVSPHEYSGGVVPSRVYGDNGLDSTGNDSKSVKTVGILLMDHGSRNAASNQRLHDLAKLYQESLLLASSSSTSSSSSSASRVIVRAAHMEIASPSIPDGLQSLMSAGVDEIVCHPYFLSPGRHVKEDIPRIVQTAVEELGIDIPIVTTNPTGSKTDVMIELIHSLVAESSAYLKN